MHGHLNVKIRRFVAVKVLIALFWVAIPCGPVGGNRRFGEICHNNLTQGRTSLQNVPTHTQHNKHNNLKLLPDVYVTLLTKKKTTFT